jgi:hypothetical protein
MRLSGLKAYWLASRLFDSLMSKMTLYKAICNDATTCPLVNGEANNR